MPAQPSNQASMQAAQGAAFQQGLASYQPRQRAADLGAASPAPSGYAQNTANSLNAAASSFGQPAPEQPQDTQQTAATSDQLASSPDDETKKNQDNAERAYRQQYGSL
jgi:hypothetical protein